MKVLSVEAPAVIKQALNKPPADHSWDRALEDSTNNLGLARALTFLKYSLSLESLVFGR